MVEGLRRLASKCSSTYRDQNFSRGRNRRLLDAAAEE